MRIGHLLITTFGWRGCQHGTGHRMEGVLTLRVESPSVLVTCCRIHLLLQFADTSVKEERHLM